MEDGPNICRLCLRDLGSSVTRENTADTVEGDDQRPAEIGSGSYRVPGMNDLCLFKNLLNSICPLNFLLIFFL